MIFDITTQNNAVKILKLLYTKPDFNKKIKIAMDNNYSNEEFIEEFELKNYDFTLLFDKYVVYHAINGNIDDFLKYGLCNLVELANNDSHFALFLKVHNIDLFELSQKDDYIKTRITSDKEVTCFFNKESADYLKYLNSPEIIDHLYLDKEWKDDKNNKSYIIKITLSLNDLNLFKSNKYDSDNYTLKSYLYDAIGKREHYLSIKNKIVVKQEDIIEIDYNKELNNVN